MDRFTWVAVAVHRHQNAVHPLALYDIKMNCCGGDAGIREIATKAIIEASAKLEVCDLKTITPIPTTQALSGIDELEGNSAGID